SAKGASGLVAQVQRCRHAQHPHLSGDTQVKLRHLLLLCLCFPVALAAQGLDPANILKPKPGTWPTYNGDYSGKRYSELKQINAGNVRDLKPAWTYNTAAGTDKGIFGAGDVKSTPLMVDGVLFFTEPDHVWAIDARTGQDLWHYQWESKGGIH